MKMNVETFESHLNKASQEYQFGFASKTAQNRACGWVNRALDVVIEDINSMILDTPLEDRVLSGKHDLYWDLCGVTCYNIERKGKNLREVMGEQVETHIEMIDQCVDLYNTFRAAEINQVKKSEHIDVKIQKSILDMMEKRGEQVNRCLKLDNMFGHMGVTASVHLVNGHKGTVFPRCFYYVMGRLTPLAVIITAMGEAERQKLLGE